MAKKQVKFRRKQYFIAPEFQLRYIRVILLIMFGVGAISAYTVYYKSMMLLGEKLANVYPQGRLVAIVKSVNIQILISLLLITPLIVIVGLFLSHRMAGPIYRMQRFLSDMAKGDISSRVTLRKRDEFKTLAESINVVVDSMRLQVTAEKDIVTMIKHEIDEAEKSPKANLSRLKEEVSKLDNSLAHYKL